MVYLHGEFFFCSPMCVNPKSDQEFSILIAKLFDSFGLLLSSKDQKLKISQVSNWQILHRLLVWVCGQQMLFSWELQWINQHWVYYIDGPVVQPPEVLWDFCSGHDQKRTCWICQGGDFQTAISARDLRGCCQEQDGIYPWNCELGAFHWWW